MYTVFSLYKGLPRLGTQRSGSHLNPSTEPRLELRVTVERQRHGLRLKLLTLGVGDNLLLPWTSIPKKQNNGSKRLSPTPSVSNLSLRPCSYLSTVTRSSREFPISRHQIGCAHALSFSGCTHAYAKCPPVDRNKC